MTGGSSLPITGLLRPDPLEIAAGFMLADLPSVARSSQYVDGERLPARQALEQVVLSAVARSPCVVDFSGGRDSSLILATATDVARREGLPLPVPFTRRFPREPMAEESDWQELVIKHLRLPEWERAELTDELDLIGQRAQRVLRHYGLLLPAPMYHWTLSFELAKGGSHLTGEGGDELFARYRARTALTSLRSPRKLHHWREMTSFLSDVAPPRARTWWLRRSYLSTSPLPSRPWMKPDAYRRLCERYAAQEGTEPFSWRRALHWQLSHRNLIAMQHNGKIIASDYDVLHSDPFLDRRFVSALARSANMFGFVDRTQAMTFLAGDLLPASLLSRRSKGRFNRAYFTEVSRAYADSWDGAGVNPELVDAEVLKREWSKPIPSAPSSAVLQAAWMAEHKVPLAGTGSSETISHIGAPRSAPS